MASVHVPLSIFRWLFIDNVSTISLDSNTKVFRKRIVPHIVSLSLRWWSLCPLQLFLSRQSLPYRHLWTQGGRNFFAVLKVTEKTIIICILSHQVLVYFLWCGYVSYNFKFNVTARNSLFIVEMYVYFRAVHAYKSTMYQSLLPSCQYRNPVLIPLSILYFIKIINLSIILAVPYCISKEYTVQITGYIYRSIDLYLPLLCPFHLGSNGATSLFKTST